MTKHRFHILATDKQYRAYKKAALKSGLRASNVAKDRMTGPWVKAIADLGAKLSARGIDPIAILESHLSS